MAAARQSATISWIRLARATQSAFPTQLFGSGTVAALLVGLAVVAMYVAHARGTQLKLVAIWALAPPVLAFDTFPVAHLFQFRYLLFTVPAWVLLAAAGIDALSRWWGSWGAPARPGPLASTVAVTLVVTLVAAGWSGQVAARHDPVIGYPDYRGAARTIGADLRPGDSIVYGGLHVLARRGMTYEMRNVPRPRDVFLYESAERRGAYVAHECPDPAACLGATRRIWLVNTTLSADALADLTPFVAALLRDRFTVSRGWEFQHLHLVLMIPRTGASVVGPSS
jgi:mannosyltransferase